MSSLDNFCAKSIRILYYLLFFFTPLVMWTKTSEVFEFNKMLFVYIITILVTALWLIKSVNSKKLTIAKTAIDIPILLFLISQFISTLLSIDRHTSIWGYYSRFHGGLASTVSYVLLFYGLITHFGNDKKAQQNIILSLISSAFLVSLYGIAEHFGIDKDMWIQDVQSRVFSTLGQPNWLSAYLITLLPLSLYLTYVSTQEHFKYFYGLASFVFLVTILYTKSKSGIGATFIILFLIVISSLFSTFKSKSHLPKKYVFGSILGLVILLFFIGTPWTPTPNSIQVAQKFGGPAWPVAEKYLNKINLTTQFKPVQMQLLSDAQKADVLRKEQGLRVGGSDSMEIRSVVWQGALELVKKYPFFGTGVDTFGYSYYWVRPASHNLLSEWDFLYNRAHNEYINFAATTGFVGLFAYLFMIGSFIYVFVKSLKQDHPLAFPLLLGFVSILITNYFGFSVVCIALLFYLFPALIISSNSKLFQLSSYPAHLNLTLSIFIISSFALWQIIGVYQSWSADIKYAIGKNGLLYGPQYLNNSIKSLETAVSKKANEPLYRSQLSEAQALAALYINEELKTLPASTAAEVKIQYQNARDSYMATALTNSETAISMNPHQTNYYKTRAKVGLYLSSIDPNYYNDVINTLLKVSEKAPTDAKVLYNIGLVYINMQKIEAAKQAISKAIELKPDYDEAINRLSQLNATPSAKLK